MDKHQIRFDILPKPIRRRYHDDPLIHAALTPYIDGTASLYSCYERLIVAQAESRTEMQNELLQLRQRERTIIQTD